MNFGWIIPVIALLSFGFTWLLRHYALSRSLLDIPNARSSHSVPTPRGGGVAIVLTFMLALAFLLWRDLIVPTQFWAIAVAGGLVAFIGFMDDHGHIAARWRLLGHFTAATWLLCWMGGLPSITIFGWQADLGVPGHLLAVVYLVWLLNLYNFMDGIDGIASVEAISVCLGACLLAWLEGSLQLIWAPLLLAVCVSGFLFWNFPPAKIFMGDAGSGFLGIVLGGLSLQAAAVSADFLWGWLILFGVFIVDATYTLLRRLLRGDKVYEAHRSHAYQFASRRFGRHLPVTIAVAAINMFWLLPIAVAVARFGLDGCLGLIVAYAPLLVLAIGFGAGKRE
jgi:Fuc2NAc and GlcNAc transferase